MSGTGDPGPTPPTPPAPPQVPAGYKSQEEINRIAAAEKEQGKSAGQKEVLAKLGVNTPEEAEALVKAARDAEAKNLGDVERLTKERDAAVTKATTSETTAKQATFDLTVYKALVEAGAPAATMDDIKLLLRLDDNADEAAITKAITDTKTRLPNMFEAPEEGEEGGDATGGGKGKGGEGKTPALPNPGRAPQKNLKPEDKGQVARNLLHEFHPSTRPKS